MNILNNNTFRIIIACVLGVVGTLVIQEVTSENELLVDTTVATGVTDTLDIVNVVDDVNGDETSDVVNTVGGLNVELGTVTTPSADVTGEGISNK